MKKYLKLALLAVITVLSCFMFFNNNTQADEIEVGEIVEFKGAQIRTVETDDGKQGVRFVATVDLDKLAAFNTSELDVYYGFLICDVTANTSTTADMLTYAGVLENGVHKVECNDLQTFAGFDNSYALTVYGFASEQYFDKLMVRPYIRLADDSISYGDTGVRNIGEVAVTVYDGASTGFVKTVIDNFLSFTKGTNDYSVRIVKFEGDTFNIPSTYCGLPVTKILTNLLDTYTNCDTVNIPDSVTTIDLYAFNNAHIKNLNIPNTVTTINKDFLYRVTGLTNITCPLLSTSVPSTWNHGSSVSKHISLAINNNPTEIYDNAFYGVYMEDFVIPEGTTTIGKLAFAGNTALKTITVPNTVTSIGNQAFSGDYSLESFDFSNITSLGDNAFNSCRGIRTVDISNVTTVGTTPFQGGRVESLTISDATTSLAGYLGTDVMSYSSLKTVVVNGGTEVCSSFANSYNKITSLTLADSIKTVGTDAFNNCYLITSLTIPSSFETVGNYAFYKCGGFSLKSLSFTGSATIGDYAFCQASITGVDLTNVTSVGDMAFASCMGISSLYIPKNITFGTTPFSSCQNLASITFEEANIPVFDLTTYVTQLATIVVEGGTEVCEQFAMQCDKLRNLTLPDTITTIKGSAFSNCSLLTNITLPTALKTIEEYAFYQTKIDYLTLPEGLDTIGAYAFSNGIDIKQSIAVVLHIPSTVTSVGTAAFNSTTSAIVDCCSGCIDIAVNAFKTEASISYKDHNYGELIVDQDPSCTVAGYGHYTCSACLTTESNIYIAPLGHSYGDEYCCERCNADQNSSSNAYEFIGRKSDLTITTVEDEIEFYSVSITNSTDTTIYVPGVHNGKPVKLVISINAPQARNIYVAKNVDMIAPDALSTIAATIIDMSDKLYLNFNSQNNYTESCLWSYWETDKKITNQLVITIAIRDNYLDRDYVIVNKHEAKGTDEMAFFERYDTWFDYFMDLMALNI